MNPIFLSQTSLNGWVVVIKEPRCKPWLGTVGEIIVEPKSAKVQVVPKSHRRVLPNCMKLSIKLVNCLHISLASEIKPTKSGGFAWSDGSSTIILFPPQTKAGE